MEVIAQNVPTVSGLNSYEWDLTGFQRVIL